MRFGRKPQASREAETARKLAELTASRRIIVSAYEIERRRIERDLHDGAQQYLVAAAMQIGEAMLSPSVKADATLAELLGQANDSITAGLAALRNTIRGIHPQLLAQQGLVAALEEVASNSANQVKIICPHKLPEMPEPVLAAGYFFACEAIANAAKYAPDAEVTVLITTNDRLIISVVDSGPGGAEFRAEHGLAGMKERLSAFDGELALSSPDGGPTQVVARIPLLLARGESGVAL